MNRAGQGDPRSKALSWVAAALVFAVCVGVGAVFFRNSTTAPRFRGQTPDYWFPRYVVGGYGAFQAKQLFALGSLEPEAMPVLVEGLHLRDSRLGMAYRDSCREFSLTLSALTPEYLPASGIRDRTMGLLFAGLDHPVTFRALTNCFGRIPSDVRVRLCLELGMRSDHQEIAVPFLQTLLANPSDKEDAMEAGMALLQRLPAQDPRLETALEGMSELPDHPFTVLRASWLARQLVSGQTPSPATERWMTRWLASTNSPHLPVIAATVLTAIDPERYPVSNTFRSLLPWNSGIPIRTLVSIVDGTRGIRHPQENEIARLLAPVLEPGRADEIAASERRGRRFTRDSYAPAIQGSVLFWFDHTPGTAVHTLPCLPQFALHPNPGIADIAQRMLSPAEPEARAWPTSKPSPEILAPVIDVRMLRP